MLYKFSDLFLTRSACPRISLHPCPLGRNSSQNFHCLQYTIPSSHARTNGLLAAGSNTRLKNAYPRSVTGIMWNCLNNERTQFLYTVITEATNALSHSLSRSDTAKLNKWIQLLTTAWCMRTSTANKHCNSPQKHQICCYCRLVSYCSFRLEIKCITDMYRRSVTNVWWNNKTPQNVRVPDHH
jgi:hypothetical protein